MSLPEPWKFVAELHPGGQAFLFEVRLEDADRRYVLKRIKNPDRTHRFEQEIDMTRSIYNEFPWAFPEIVDFGWGEKDDRLYYVMPWFPGSLQDEVDDARYVENPAAGVSRLIELVDRIALLHTRGWAHRDLKPANVLVSQSNELILADLGLAIRTLAEDQGRETPEWEAIGSRYYIAPENEDGKFDGPEHRPCDFYALGKIAWVLLTGRRPLSRETQLESANRLSYVLGDDRLSAIDDLCDQLLVRDPQARLAKWGGVRTELQAVVAHLTGDPRSPAPAKDSLQAAKAAARAFRRSPQASAISEGRERDTSRTRRYLDLTQAAYSRANEFGAEASAVTSEFDGHFQLVLGSQSRPTFGDLLLSLRSSWPHEALTQDFDEICLERGCALEGGIDSLFTPTPPSVLIDGFVLLAGEDVWTLIVRLISERRVVGVDACSGPTVDA